MFWLLRSTIYTPEELLAMILDYARELAADFGGKFYWKKLNFLKKKIFYFNQKIEQSIDACVISVPPYFNQAERKAVLRAAEMVNLKVLQLINSNTAG